MTGTSQTITQTRVVHFTTASLAQGNPHATGNLRLAGGEEVIVTRTAMETVQEGMAVGVETVGGHIYRKWITCPGNPRGARTITRAIFQA